MIKEGEGVMTYDAPSFQSVCPNITQEPPLPKNVAAAEEEGLYQPKVFSEHGLLSQLRFSILFLKVLARFSLEFHCEAAAVDGGGDSREVEKMAHSI
jgi:hypothetical protein